MGSKRQKPRREAQAQPGLGLVRSQHGVISRRQLLRARYSRQAIEHTNVLERPAAPVHRGVYAVGRASSPSRGDWMAAILACGEARRSATAAPPRSGGVGKEKIWERTARSTTPLIELSVPRICRPRAGRPARPPPPPCPPATSPSHRGIPVTSIVRTLLDLRDPRTAQPGRARRQRGRQARPDRPEALRRAIEAYPGEPGVRALRKVLDKRHLPALRRRTGTPVPPLAREAGLPLPRSKEIVNDFEVDFYWPDLGLVVETDGWRYHRTPAAQTRDALRFQRHTASGLTPLRFSHRQVKHEPAHVVGILRATASRLRR